MNLKEFAKENNITLAEAKSITGLTHWAQKVPDALPEIIDEGVALTEEELFEEAPVDLALDMLNSVSDEAKRRSVNGLGTKSPFWKELRG